MHKDIGLQKKCTNMSRVTDTVSTVDRKLSVLYLGRMTSFTQCPMMPGLASKEILRRRWTSWSEEGGREGWDRRCENGGRKWPYILIAEIVITILLHKSQPVCNTHIPGPLWRWHHRRYHHTVSLPQNRETLAAGTCQLHN